MTADEFLFLFDGEEKERVRIEIDNGISFAIIGGVPVLYMGNLPSLGAIMISSFNTSTLSGAKELYVSSLEASIDGVEIVTYAECYGPSSVLRGVEDGEGRLHVVSALGIRKFIEGNKDRARRILVRGGSIITPGAGIYDRKRAEYVASRLSISSLSYMGGEYLHPSNPVLSMLDDGKDVSILRSSLQSRAGRKLASEGCPVSSSYSSFSEFAGNIVYHSDKGRFSFLDERYDSYRYP